MAGRKQPESAGSRLKGAVLERYLLDPAEEVILDEAVAEADVCARINEAVAAAPLTVPGSRGQEVANPLLLQQRKHHERLQRLLEALRLPLKDEMVGSSSTSKAAQEAARERWRLTKGRG
jgi:hypothetical protein